MIQNLDEIFLDLTEEEVRTRLKLPSSGSLSAVTDLVQLIDEGPLMQEDKR